MKRIIQLSAFFFFFFLLGSSEETVAQCNSIFGYTNDGTLTPTGAWQTVATSGKRYRTFNATLGNVYEFSYCAAFGGGSSAFDTEITITNTSGTPVAGAYNDNFCGNQSYLPWLCTANGTYRVVYTRKTCNTQSNMGTLAYRFYTPACPGNLGTGVTNVPSLPYAAGAGTTSGKINDLNSSNITSCGDMNYVGGEDAVWIFTPSATGVVVIKLLSSGNRNGFKLYQGCPLLGQGGTCVANTTGNGNLTLTTCVTSGQTYYLILDVYPNPTPTFSAYTDLTISAPDPCPLGTGVVAVASLPYVSNGRTTCSKVNDLTSSNITSCGIDNYFTGEDEVFIFTPATSGNVTVTLTSAGSRTGLVLYNTCPLSGFSCIISASCIASEQSTSGNKSLCANVTAGVTYYLIVDSWSSPACNNYNISIDAPSNSLPGATCLNAISIPSLPYTATNETTKCRGNDYTNASIGSCGTIYESGEDKVYTYTAIGAECIGITITGANSNSIGFQVYNGCPGTVGTTCVGNAGGASNGTLSGTIILNTAGTYYIVVDNQSAPSYVNYNLSITSYGAGAPNDLPCNAIPLTLGVAYIGSNTCSNSAGEPAALPACWGPGSNPRNTVWFSAVAPASQKLRIRAIPNSLTNTQIAVYKGVCGNTMTLVGCNNDTSSCGTTPNLSSDLNLSGLTAGATYYIVVDGYGTLTGSFSVLIIDGALPLPPLSNGQDCGTYVQVCDTSMSFGNPGYQSFGNICDFDGSGPNCLNAGERGSVWFEIPINSNGILEFSIVPKDWPGAPSTSATDYDFAVWKIQNFDGTVARTCADIRTNVITPDACNYSPLGVTGLYSASNNVPPPQYPGFGGAFQKQLNVLNGEVYTLVVSNYSTSTSGFDIIFSNPSNVAYIISGSETTWSGGVDTDWYKKENWGGCALPSCSIDAIINGGIVLQPNIATGTANAKSVIINPGATLTLSANRTLNVCEDFLNLGSFTAKPGSNVVFNNSSFVQSIDGNLLAANAFANVRITKTGGLVKMLQDVEMTGNFLITNGLSSFSANNNTHIVGGHFINLGNYTPGTGGTLLFNGTIGQTYNNYSQLNNVVVNNTSATGVHVETDVNMASTGNLTLISGVLHLDPFTEVQVNNRATNAVTQGNDTSYVDGVLRRYINPNGSYDFPVGEASKGFQRVNINFNDTETPTVIDNITAKFQTYSSLPSPVGGTDCGGIIFNDPPLNNGYWFIDASNSPNSGNFDMTLYNKNYTNVTYKWTIMSDDGFNWNIANGNCAPSIATAVTRTGMFGLGTNFGTAQAPSLLPVELLSFEARALSSTILLSWSTASEKENRGFEIYRSDASGNFKVIGWVDGNGNSTSIHNYTFEDKDVVTNKLYYYHLRQIDFNGAASISPIVTARLKSKIFSASIFPNPVTDEAILNYFIDEDATVELSIVNVLGEEVLLQKKQNQQAGSQYFIIHPSSFGLASGLYSLRIKVNGNEEFLKLVVAGK